MSYKLQLIQDGVVKYEIAEGERKKVAIGTYIARLVRDGEVLKEETVNIDVGQIFFYGYKIETKYLADTAGEVSVSGPSESLSDSVGEVV